MAKKIVVVPTEEGKKSLEFLKKIDLETIDFTEVKKHTDILVRCGFSVGIAEPLKLWIYRGVVVNVDEIPKIKNVKRISYRPKKADDQFSLNRASSNRYEVFYGGIPTPDFDDAKISAVLEIDTIRDESFPEDEYQYIAMGLWFVKEPFIVASVGMHSEIAKNSQWARAMAGKDLEFFDEIENADFIKEVMQFMADEFGKEVPKGKDFLYKISAAYGDSLFDIGIKAIMFPSLQTGAKSFNMAIKSDLVDEKFIDIEAAAIMRGSKIKQEIFFGWFLQCARIFSNELKWEEPPRRAQISQNELEQFKRIIEEKGVFSENPRVIS